MATMTSEKDWRLIRVAPVIKTVVLDSVANTHANAAAAVGTRVLRRIARGLRHHGVRFKPETLCHARRAPGRDPR